MSKKKKILNYLEIRLRFHNDKEIGLINKFVAENSLEIAETSKNFVLCKKLLNSIEMDQINNTLNFIDKRINSIFAPLIKKEIKNSELYNTKIAAELLKRIEYLDSKNTVILNWILQLSDIDINEANEPNETNKDLWLRDPDFLNELYEELKITYDKWIKKRVTKFDITEIEINN